MSKGVRRPDGTTIGIYRNPEAMAAKKARLEREYRQARRNNPEPATINPIPQPDDPFEGL